MTSGLHAIVLAAGAGVRFGGGKLLAPFGRGTLLSAAIEIATAAPVESLVVVVGCEADRVAEAAAAVVVGRRLKVVLCPDWRDGMSASLKAGVAAVPADSAGAFVFLGDMPRVPIEVLPRLARAVLEGADAAWPVFAGRQGHPVVLGRALLAEVAGLRGDAGARALLRRPGLIVREVPTEDDGAVSDVDTDEQLRRLSARPKPATT